MFNWLRDFLKGADDGLDGTKRVVAKDGARPGQARGATRAAPNNKQRGAGADIHAAKISHAKSLSKARTGNNDKRKPGGKQVHALRAPDAKKTGAQALERKKNAVASRRAS